MPGRRMAHAEVLESHRHVTDGNQGHSGEAMPGRRIAHAEVLESHRHVTDGNQGHGGGAMPARRIAHAEVHEQHAQVADGMHGQSGAAMPGRRTAQAEVHEQHAQVADGMHGQSGAAMPGRRTAHADASESHAQVADGNHGHSGGAMPGRRTVHGDVSESHGYVADGKHGQSGAVTAQRRALFAEAAPDRTGGVEEGFFKHGSISRSDLRVDNDDEYAAHMLALHESSRHADARVGKHARALDTDWQPSAGAQVGERDGGRDARVDWSRAQVHDSSGAHSGLAAGARDADWARDASMSSHRRRADWDAPQSRSQTEDVLPGNAAAMIRNHSRVEFDGHATRLRTDDAQTMKNATVARGVRSTEWEAREGRAGRADEQDAGKDANTSRVPATVEHDMGSRERSVQVVDAADGDYGRVMSFAARAEEEDSGRGPRPSALSDAMSSLDAVMYLLPNMRDLPGYQQSRVVASDRMGREHVGSLAGSVTHVLKEVEDMLPTSHALQWADRQYQDLATREGSQRAEHGRQLEIQQSRAHPSTSGLAAAFRPRVAQVEHDRVGLQVTDPQAVRIWADPGQANKDRAAWKYLRMLDRARAAPRPAVMDAVLVAYESDAYMSGCE